MSNFRGNNIGASYDYHNKMGYSSVSRNYGYSQRSIHPVILDQGAFNDDHNLGEIEYMLENERKKFKEAKEKF